MRLPSDGERSNACCEESYKAHKELIALVENIAHSDTTFKEAEGIIKEHWDALALHPCGGETILHKLCWNENSLPDESLFDLVQMLVEHQPEILRVKDDEGRVPLYAACWGHCPLKVIRYLVEKDPETLTLEDNEGCWHALHCACMEKTPLEVVEYLVQQSRESLLHRDLDGNLPLHLALSEGRYGSLADPEVIKYLACMGPGALKERDSFDEQVPMHLAASASLPDVVRALNEICQKIL